MIGFHEFISEFNDALSRCESMAIFARCEIVYSGRAESQLLSGDRMLLIKSDKSMLIHQPTGSAPVNWMKEDSDYALDIEGDSLMLRVRNLPLKEYLDIKIEEIYSFSRQKLEDGQKIIITGSERDMSDMILENPELIEKGFKPLSREEHTKYGFIDVFGYDANNVLVVIEAKRYSADFKAVSQLRRYVEKVRKSKGLEKVRGILAAPQISANAEKMLHDFGFEYRKISPPKYMERFHKKQSNLNFFSDKKDSKNHD
ncbi:endonuclease NucS [Candidatus Woesearchaeota archaeon CG07_land_8_20_14_0_80_44_23]|nr:MAG: endonuclease NucS [Candidatus Woesearchaeota archaeon CG07_land_8_20_14_0_80_44_23]